MKIKLNTTVLEEARNRMRWIYDEFEEVVVCFSGGKDSTVVFNLALEVAKELNRLPVPVVFIDQEAEWQGNIDYIRRVMTMPEVKPYWFQMPIKIFNATTHNTDDQWLNCWGEGEEWMRPKESYSIKENNYGTDRFAELFNKIIKKEFSKKSCTVGGVRMEESPARRLGLGTGITYKDVTWGTKNGNANGEYPGFYPIYDWSYTDVWKYIQEYKLDYCKIYDEYFRLGRPVKNMRISNLNHETALKSVFELQEIEPDTWNKIVKRIPEYNSAKRLGAEGGITLNNLPDVFSTWLEYRNFLYNKLLDDEQKSYFEKAFIKADVYYKNNHYIYDKINKILCKEIIINDFELTKLLQLYASYNIGVYTNWKNGSNSKAHSKEFIIETIKERYPGLIENGDAPLTQEERNNYKRRIKNVEDNKTKK